MTFVVRIFVKTTGFFLCFLCKSRKSLTTVSAAKQATKHVTVFLAAFDINGKQLLYTIKQICWDDGRAIMIVIPERRQLTDE